MRCPHCHKEFIPDEKKCEWLRKWNRDTEPSLKEHCRICGATYGEHNGIECPN